MREEINRHRGGAGSVIRYNRHGQYREPGQARDDNLDIAAALVAGGTLLQAIVRVGGSVAIQFLEGHRRPGIGLDAGLCDSQCLRKQQRGCKQPGGVA